MAPARVVPARAPAPRWTRGSPRWRERCGWSDRRRRGRRDGRRHGRRDGRRHGRRDGRGQRLRGHDGCGHDGYGRLDERNGEHRYRDDGWGRRREHGCDDGYRIRRGPRCDFGLFVQGSRDPRPHADVVHRRAALGGRDGGEATAPAGLKEASIRSLRRNVLAAGVLHLASAIGCASADAPESAHGCAPPAGASGAPSSISEAVNLINALVAARSDEVTVPCLVESLDRPLGVLAAKSLFSAQPSIGVRSPRIFLFSGDLVMTIVPAGAASTLLELAELTTSTRSIKAEVHFPVHTPLSEIDPYERVLFEAGTTCGGCHHEETAVEEMPSRHRFESAVFRPRPQEEVPISLSPRGSACVQSRSRGRTLRDAELAVRSRRGRGAPLFARSENDLRRLIHQP